MKILGLFVIFISSRIVPGSALETSRAQVNCHRRRPMGTPPRWAPYSEHWFHLPATLRAPKATEVSFGDDLQIVQIARK